jgi:hypothetical protein
MQSEEQNHDQSDKSPSKSETAPAKAFGFTWPKERNFTLPRCKGKTTDGRSGAFLTPIEGSSGVTIDGRLSKKRWERENERNDPWTLAHRYPHQGDQLSNLFAQEEKQYWQQL